MRPFQFAGEGSHTSMPIPAEVEGAEAGPGFPGATLSLTRHRSFGATDGDVPDNVNGSPFLNCLTSNTVVLASGLNAVLMLSSHVSAVGCGAGAGAGAESLSPPHPCSCLLYTSDAADERSSVDLGG